MVAHKTTKRTPITEGFAGKYIFLGLIFCLIATVVLIGLYIYRGLTTPAPCDEPTDEETTEVEPEEPALPDAINFQSVIDQFVSSTSGNRSVMVYDVERNEMAGEYNPTERDYHNTASLYKLFVVYEGYRRIQNGAWDQNAKIGYTGNTLLECLDRAIRESYSPCAETLWAMIGHAELDAIIKADYNILGSNISGLS